MPEWVPCAGTGEWHQTVRALVQLWREVGHLGVIASGPIAWMPQADWDHRPTTWHPHYPHLDHCRWLFAPHSEHYHPEQPDGPEQLDRDGSLVSGSTLAIATCHIPLAEQDPLAEEQFLWFLTPVFGAVAVQGRHPHTGQPGILVSFEPEAMQHTWQALRHRIRQSDALGLAGWDRVIQSFPPQDPHHRVLAHYSTLLLLSTRAEGGATAQLPHGIPSPSHPHLHPALPQETLVAGLNPESPTHLHDRAGVEQDPIAKTDQPQVSTGSRHGQDTSSTRPTSPAAGSQPGSHTHEEPKGVSEAELLRALVHEINTPLSAILTRVRLALKQPNLPARTQEHLHKIEQECLEQIERFKLFFQATERDPQRLQLEPTALVTILKEKLPRWQEQVRRRGSHLDIEIPADLPNVVSDPQRLDTILSGMIDRVARISPPGSDIRIQVVSAGEQVKLQLQVKGTEGSLSHPSGSLPTQAIGQILVLQPETGAISLSIPVTQTLFRALGGYFTVRHRAEQGDVFTIYLPRQI